MPSRGFPRVQAGVGRDARVGRPVSHVARTPLSWETHRANGRGTESVWGAVSTGFLAMFVRLFSCFDYFLTVVAWSRQTSERCEVPWLLPTRREGLPCVRERE